MANQKISQLTEKTTLDGGEELVYAQSGANGKLKVSKIKEFSKELPDQTGNSGKFLKTNGTSAEWFVLLDANGKIINSLLPALVITDTFTVSTASDLTSLSSAEKGDIAIATSENKTYILSAEPYSIASNWKEILTPTGGVTSVNSQTGAITLKTINNTALDGSGNIFIPEYSDFEFETATSGATLTVSYLNTNFTPNQDFSIACGTLKEGMQYIVRINTGATAYTMSLGTGITNPFGEDLTLTASKITTLVFLATSSSTLELFSARTAS